MGKKVLITGSNKGLGFELARTLLKDCPDFEKIILTSRNLELGLAALEKLGNSDRLDYHILDVTNEQSILALHDYILSKYGKIDILVNNAGLFPRPPETFENYKRPHLETNFYGVVHMTEAFLPLLEPSGHVINLSSWLGKTEFLKNEGLARRFLDPDMSINQVMELANEYNCLGSDWAEKGWDLNEFGPHSVTKALVNSYTRVLARDLLSINSKIRINAVHPGWVKTDMGTDEAPLTIEEGVKMPLMVVTDPSEITGKYWADGHWEEFS